MCLFFFDLSTLLVLNFCVRVKFKEPNHKYAVAKLPKLLDIMRIMVRGHARALFKNKMAKLLVTLIFGGITPFPPLGLFLGGVWSEHAQTSTSNPYREAIWLVNLHIFASLARTHLLS